MTPIKDMLPGPEMDELVDVKLFGMEFKTFPYGRMCYRNGGWTLAKPYSIDISATYEVLRKMRRRGFNYRIEAYKKGKVTAAFYDEPGNFGEYEADTEAHAIVIAALMAVGGE